MRLTHTHVRCIIRTVDQSVSETPFLSTSAIVLPPHITGIERGTWLLAPQTHILIVHLEMPHPLQQDCTVRGSQAPLAQHTSLHSYIHVK